jgi:hypothetical protein
MSSVDLSLRILDVASMWILLSDDKKIAEQRLSIFGGLFAAVAAINVGQIYLLYSTDDLSAFDLFLPVMQMLGYVVALSLMMLGKDASNIGMKEIRRVFLVWVSFTVLFEPLLTMYAETMADLIDLKPKRASVDLSEGLEF